MARYKSSFHFERYFIIFGVLVSILALGVIVFASQKPTNTESHASGGCIMTPQIKYISKEARIDNAGRKWGYLFSMKVWNDSEIGCGKVLNYITTESIPIGWGWNYKNHIPEGLTEDFLAFDDLFPQQKQTLKLEVMHPRGLKNGTYYLPVKVCRSIPQFCPSGDQCGLEERLDDISAYASGLTDKCTKIKLEYIKD